MLSVDFLGDTCFLVNPFVKPLVRLHLCVVEVGAEAVVEAAFDFQLEAETLEWIETSDCLNVSFKNKEKVNKHSAPNINSPLQFWYLFRNVKIWVTVAEKKLNQKRRSRKRGLLNKCKN